MSRHFRCEPPVPEKVRIPQDGAAPLAYVLAELEALGLREEGLRLWRVLRRLEDPRRGMEPGEDLADVAPELQPTLGALHALLGEPSRDAATREALALGCAHVAAWAEERGAYRTALGFLQAAGELLPGNPHFAYDVGRVARKMALYDDAEAWLKWAHFAARRARRWDVATLAVSGLGNLHRQRGNLPRARRHHELARRLARRHDLRTLEGDALYDLCVISLAGGDGTGAIEFARGAIRAYGAGHSQVHRLANDIAWFWMEHYGKFESAASVFTVLLDHIWQPAYRVLLLGNLARAAAGAGWRDVFEEMWIEAWSTIRQHTSREAHAAALLQLARGAGTIGAWDRAGIAASEALTVARARREGEMIVVAETMLNVLDAQVLSDDRIEEVFQDRQRMRDAVADAEAGELVVELSSAMRARRDDAPESPIHALIRSGA